MAMHLQNIMRRDKLLGICDQWTPTLAYVSIHACRREEIVKGMIKSAWCRNVDNIYILCCKNFMIYNLYYFLYLNLGTIISQKHALLS